MREAKTRIWCGALVLGLLGLSGCVPCYYHCQSQPACVEACQNVPCDARNKVYVFLVNGFDPTNCANFSCVRDYVHELGFIKTYYGQFFYTNWYCDEIRRIHECEPDARFALVGFSLGADAVRKVAESVGQDGIPIDLLIYVDAVSVPRNCTAVPGNVGRAINLVSNDVFLRGAEIDMAENHHLIDANHFALPTHLFTLETLSHELMQVACHVPIVQPIEAVMPMIEESAPTPRPIKQRSMKPRDEWDFLKPVHSLSTRPDVVRYQAGERLETMPPLSPADTRQTAR